MATKSAFRDHVTTACFRPKSSIELSISQSVRNLDELAKLVVDAYDHVEFSERDVLCDELDLNEEYDIQAP